MKVLIASELAPTAQQKTRLSAGFLEACIPIYIGMIFALCAQIT